MNTDERPPSLVRVLGSRDISCGRGHMARDHVAASPEKPAEFCTRPDERFGICGSGIEFAAVTAKHAQALKCKKLRERIARGGALMKQFIADFGRLDDSATDAQRGAKAPVAAKP